MVLYNFTPKLFEKFCVENFESESGRCILFIQNILIELFFSQSHQHFLHNFHIFLIVIARYV